MALSLIKKLLLLSSPPVLGGGDIPDPGQIFLVDDDGSILTDNDNLYLEEAA